MDRAELLVYILFFVNLVLLSLVTPVYAQNQIIIEPLGNGTVQVQLPDNTTCDISYRLVGDNYYIKHTNLSGTINFDLPYGKYEFNITCDNNETLNVIVDNQPAYKTGPAKYVLLVTLALVALHVWRRGVVTMALSIIFVWYFISNYMAAFDAATQGMLLFGYIAVALLLVLYSRS